MKKLRDYSKILAEYEKEQEKERKKTEDAEAARAEVIKEAQVVFSLSVQYRSFVLSGGVRRQR